jgi:hypothetical protein
VPFALSVAHSDKGLVKREADAVGRGWDHRPADSDHFVLLIELLCELVVAAKRGVAGTGWGMQGRMCWVGRAWDTRAGWEVWIDPGSTQTVGAVDNQHGSGSWACVGWRGVRTPIHSHKRYSRSRRPPVMWIGSDLRMQTMSSTKT